MGLGPLMEFTPRGQKIKFQFSKVDLIEINEIKLRRLFSLRFRHKSDIALQQ